MGIQGTLLLAMTEGAERRALAAALAEGGYGVREAASGFAALKAAKADAFAAYLLAFELPDIDGTETCRLLRRQRVQQPIMVVGSGSEAETILALNTGANDYVARSGRPEVLLARLRAHLRQHQESEAAAIALENLVFQPGLKRLVNAKTGRKTHLTDKEAKVLKCLLRADGDFVPREALEAAAWEREQALGGHTLETHVYRLRQKIEQDPRRPRIILTELGGYRLALAAGVKAA